MLSQKFLKVWFAGRLNEESIEALRRKIAEALVRRERRMLFRFYLDEGSREPYYDALRRILLENVSLSIVIEERPASQLQDDLEKEPDENLFLILGEGAPRISPGGNVIVEEVCGHGREQV